MALDVGDRRIGFACSDPTGLLATPAGVYRRRDLVRDVEYVASKVQEYEAEAIVVGLPVNMDGLEGPQAAKTRGFAEALERAGLDVSLWDERLSTIEATRMLLDQGMKPKQVERHVDEVAASIILESFLRSRQSTSARRAV